MIKPQFKIKKDYETETYGRFILEPLDQGYGHTLGNSLRRVLLSSLKGAAVTKIKIDGVRHQFSTISGVKEDVVELILNIKKIKMSYEGDKPVMLKLSAKGNRKVLAKDIECPPQVKIANEDEYICFLTSSKAKFNMELWVESGYGYSPFEERKEREIGVIPIDAIFSPITRVNYKVQATRVGRKTDLDKLIMEIWTDGSITPLLAMHQAARILVSYLTHIYAPKIEEKQESIEEEILSPVLARLTLEELDLPTRIVNSLRKGNIETVQDLVFTERAELLNIKNVGLKSISLIEKELQKRGVKIGVGVEKQKEEKNGDEDKQDREEEEL